MSVKHKQERLVEIREILSSRCSSNSELYHMLMREKERLEKELTSTKSYKPEKHKPEHKHHKEVLYKGDKHRPAHADSPTVDNSHSLIQSKSEIKHAKSAKKTVRKATEDAARIKKNKKVSPPFFSMFSE